jgi:hypothetical protein
MKQAAGSANDLKLRSESETQRNRISVFPNLDKGLKMMKF